LLPHLPEILIVGQAPIHMIKYTECESNLLWAVSHIDCITQTRFMGDGESWEHFFSKSQPNPSAYNQNVINKS